MQQDGAHTYKYMSVKKGRLWGLNFSLFPALIVAALPKCPLCFMSVMSVVGLGSLIQSFWLLPLTLIFLALAVGAMIIRARQRHGYYPFFLGVISAIAIYIGKFQVDYALLTYIGFALLVYASLWNNWPRKQIVSADSCDC
jgi:hypothetical protein